MVNVPEVHRKRAGRSGRAAKTATDSISSFNQLPWQQVRNPFPPFKFITDDQVEDIHNAALEVLETIGLNFLSDEARDLLKAAGADVTDGNTRVRFDRNLIANVVAKAPSEYTMHARNPERNLHWGGDSMTYGMVASPPHVSALDMPRQAGTFDTYCDFLKLAQSLNIVHMIAGYPVEPQDIAPRLRHLDAYQAMVRHCDKVNFVYALGRDRIRDSLAMTAIAHGISMDELKFQPSVFTVVNANSPLQYDTPMLTGMMEMAKYNQPVVVTPFTLAGAMAPVTIAGALVQQHAEALAGIAMIQITNPGAPCVYGGFTSNVDMKTGSPAFGTPEHAKSTIIGGQLARRVGVPYRASNVNASNAPDAQATYESQMTIWGCTLGHCNLMMHGFGWIEGGLCASYEKVIIDAEMLQMMSEFVRPLDTSREELGIEAMEDVGPGGHYFGTQHTLDRYESAFYSPMLSDWRNFETWEDHGAVDATHRAHKVYKELIASYEPPPLDTAIDTELEAFVRRRHEEGGVPED